MRDVLILSIVAGAALAALGRPWIGVMLWTWLSIMNPHRYGWGIAYAAPVAAIAAGVTLFGLLFTRERQSPFQGPAVWWLAAFTIWLTLSWQMGIDPEGDYPMWDRVMKIYLMTFVALALLRTKHHIMAFAWVTTASIGLLSAKGGVFTILTGGNNRTFGPPESFIADNNAFALATIMAIPMLHFLQLQLKRPWMRHVMTCAILLSVASALGSHSRGALVALAAMSAVFWLHSRHKKTVGVLIVVGALAALPLMPEQWWNRMETIQTYEEDGSAMGRINAWYVAWGTAQSHFFGGGMSYQYQHLFLEYGPYDETGRPRAAHSIYFQVLGNHGFVGLFLFGMLWVATYRSAGWLRREARAITEARWASDLGAMVQVSLIAFATGGAFLSLSYFDLPYNLMVMVVLARKWVERRAWEAARAPSLPGPAGAGHPRLQPTRPGGMAFIGKRGDTNRVERRVKTE